MSVIQILDSSKSNRVIYLVASAVLCAAVFNAAQISIELSFDSLTLFTTCVSGLALILWAGEVDIYIVELVGLWKFWNHSDTEQLQLKMVSILLFLKPWEESLHEASTIEETLKGEYKRVARGQEFRDQVGTFHQIFWSMILAIPSIYIASSLLPQIGAWWILVGIGLTFGIITPLWIRNRNILQRIRSYTLTLWLHETITSGLQKRKITRHKFPLENKDVLDTISNMTKEIMDLVLKQDWDGYDRNSRNITLLVGSAILSSITIEAVERYFRLLEWILANNEKPWNVNVQLDRTLRNASKQISDLCKTYKRIRSEELSDEDHTVVDILEGMATHLSDLESFIKPPIELFALYDSESLQLLSSESYETLLFLPYTVQDFEKPSLDDYHYEMKYWIIRLSQSLVEAAEYNHLDMWKTINLISTWGVNLAHVERYLGPNAGKVFWEKNLDLEELSKDNRSYMSLLDVISSPIVEHLKESESSVVEARLAILVEKQEKQALLEYLNVIFERYPKRYHYSRSESGPKSVEEVFDDIISSLEEALPAD